MLATKESVAGRRYLELQRKAQHTARPTDELIQLYALEGFLDRLTRSAQADRFVLKGEVLLAALDARWRDFLDLYVLIRRHVVDA